MASRRNKDCRRSSDKRVWSNGVGLDELDAGVGSVGGKEGTGAGELNGWVGADVGRDAVDGARALINASTSGTSVVRTRSSSERMALIILCSVGGSFTLGWVTLDGGAWVGADGSGCPPISATVEFSRIL